MTGGLTPGCSYPYVLLSLSNAGQNSINFCLFAVYMISDGRRNSYIRRTAVSRLFHPRKVKIQLRRTATTLERGMNLLMQFAIYLRKSRAEEQADLEETLRRHKETLLKFAQSQNFPVSSIYEEVVSGESLFARPQMMALLEHVQAGAFDAVLCMDIDRLGRGGMRDQGIILDTFKFSDTKIITPDKTYDLNDEIDEELTEFKTFLSRREYKIINKRLRRGLRQTILDGGYVANAPYGYKREILQKKPSLQIIEEEAAFVRMMFRMYVEEGMGTCAIAEALSAMGAKPRRADRFCRTSVGLILKNPVYIGKIVWDRSKWIRRGARDNERHITQRQPAENWLTAQGIHPAIIQEEYFNKAQQIMKSRAHPPVHTGHAGRIGTVKNPLAGLVRCAVCGKTMQRRGGSGTAYLLCPTPGCVAGAKADAVEKALLESLFPLLNRIFWTDREHSDHHSLIPVWATARREHGMLCAQRRKLHELLERGIYDDETFCARRDELDERIFLTEQILRKWNSQKEESEFPTVSVYEIYCQKDAGGRNAILKTILDHVEYDKIKKSAPLDFTLAAFLKPFKGDLNE